MLERARKRSLLGTLRVGHRRQAPNETVERVKGIEPSSKAWEAAVLPLNYTRIRGILA
jgi:hypothetical protein